MTRYLITGGAGFIGSHIANALTMRGNEVRIFDNLSTGKLANLDRVQQHVEFVRGDLRDAEAVRSVMRGVDVVFHEAAQVSVPRSVDDPQESLDINVGGMHNVLLAARDAGVRRVVFASSCAVYGESPELPKREDMLPSPLSPYAAHKLTGEQLCAVFSHLYQLEAVALRYFNVFGPGQDPMSAYAAAIPRFLSALMSGQRPIVYGDGEQTRDFVYIDNIVRANLLAASASEAPGQVFNIGCGEMISLNALLRHAGDVLGVPVEPDYKEPRAGDIRASVADISRARLVLGYEPSVGFAQGLVHTVEALRIGMGAQ